MAIQNQIKRQLRSSLAEIENIISCNSDANRTAIANELCAHFNFFDARSKPQTSSCLKALRELDSAGDINLPKPTRARPKKTSTPRLNAPVPEPENLPESADELRIELVENADQRRTWNEMIIREHPLGKRPLVGRQLRYLIVSEHGYLGAAGFGSAALNLRDREQWIGWDDALRRDHLDKIGCISRFLIRPSVECKNLASHAGLIHKGESR